MAALAMALLAGCSKDDDEGGSDSLIVGKWVKTYSTYVEYRDGVITSEHSGPSGDGSITEFKANGTIYYSNGHEEECWTLEGDKFTFYGDGEHGTEYTVLELTSNKLILELREEFYNIVAITTVTYTRK